MTGSPLPGRGLATVARMAGCLMSTVEAGAASEPRVYLNRRHLYRAADIGDPRLERIEPECQRLGTAKPGARAHLRDYVANSFTWAAPWCPACQEIGGRP